MNAKELNDILKTHADLKKFKIICTICGRYTEYNIGENPRLSLCGAIADQRVRGWHIKRNPWECVCYKCKEASNV